MNTNKKTPKLRFKGFTDDWEQRKLESLFTKYEDKVSTPDSGYWRLGLRSHCKGTFYTYVDAGHELETTEMYRVKAGNFILNITFAWERALAVTDDEDQGKLVSHRFPQFKPNDDLVIDFFKHTLMDKRFKHHLELSSPGGAGRNKVLKVSDMLKYELLVPSIQEQNIISSFLNNVDYIITLHQRKLEKLKLNKSALLQKLFPQKGCTIPDVRFKGFTDAWEQRKLGDVAIITGGGTPSTNVPEYWNGDIDWYSPVEIGKNRYVSKSTRKITKLGLEKSSAKLLPIGTVLFTSRAGIGNTAILQAEGCTNQGFQSITPDSKELDTYFLYTMTPRLKRYGEVTGAGSTFVEVSGKQMEKMSLVLPSLEEQKQIGRFFRTIDDSITLHQRKLDCLISIKKGLLQQLFV